jgi:excisionase family DNA binding protein
MRDYDERLSWPTSAEAARRLGVTPDMVRRLARAGRIGFVETGHGRLLDPVSIEAYAHKRAARRRA